MQLLVLPNSRRPTPRKLRRRTLDAQLCNLVPDVPQLLPHQLGIRPSNTLLSDRRNVVQDRAAALGGGALVLGVEEALRDQGLWQTVFASAEALAAQERKSVPCLRETALV